MQLLTFNHHSIDQDSSIEDINTFFLNLVQGIDAYTKSNKSQLYTDIDNLITYEIANNYKISDAIKALTDRDLQLNIVDFMSVRCNQDCLNNLSKDEEEKILDYEIYFKEEGYQAKEYTIMAFTLEKNAILLSFNRDIWTEYNIKGTKKQNFQDTDIYFNNIATEEHALCIIKDDIIEKLTSVNVEYTSSFMTWLSLREIIHIEHIVDKINFAMEHKLERRSGAIGKIDSKINNLFEVVVGSPHGMEDAQIRVFFKDFGGSTYVLYGFIKQNEYGVTYQKAGHIDATLQIIEDEKLNDI